MNSYQKEYLGVWNKAFAQFFGWSEDQTLGWAKPLLENLALPGAVLNEPPMYYVAREIAWNQPYCDELSAREMFELIRAIRDILSPIKRWRNFPPGFDFNAAKSKLDKLLRETEPR